LTWSFKLYRSKTQPNPPMQPTGFAGG